MRDLVVQEALRTMAADAAKRLHELVAAGEEIPYDVREPGSGSALCEYAPLTERFIRKHASLLREVESFGTACAALESAELAGPYLAQAGTGAPAEPRRRAELAAVAFLCRLWGESTDFSLSADRLDAAIAEVESAGELSEDELEVIVPLRGFQMPAMRLDLATATIVRADTVDVPVEARSQEGTAAAGWEPTFLAVARVGVLDPDGGQAPDAGARAVEAFKHLITSLRLFKPGGVGLGPHAWTRAGGGRWRRVATGAGRPRAGGYRLTEEELADAAAFSRALAHRSTPFGHPAKGRPGLAGALARAVARFEAGLERASVLDALNDYLLALRFLLEGGGPADLGLPMRIAALCAEPESRGGVKAVVDRGLALERELWSGDPAPAGDGVPTPAETAAGIEELARAILKDAACGHLGADLRVTADEILLADGLAAGDGAADQRGATSEWENLPEESEAGIDELPEPEGPEVPEEEAMELADELERITGPDEWFAWDDESEVKVPEPAGRITVERAPRPEEEKVKAQMRFQAAVEAAREGPPTEALEVPEEPDRQEPDRLEGIGRQTRVDELLTERPAERERIAGRVAYLFPRPETTEWDVREIGYDRRRRASVS